MSESGVEDELEENISRVPHCVALAKCTNTMLRER